MTTYQLAIDIALIGCCLGILVRMGRWMTRRVGSEARVHGSVNRLGNAAAAVGRCMTPRGLIRTLNVLVCEVLLQTHIAKDNPWRWVMHLAIFWGMVLLILFHALDDVVSDGLFSDYASTLNPYLFLRDALGALVLAGVVTAWIRRVRIPALKAVTSRWDLAVLALLTVIIGSGVLLHSTQIISERLFDEMVTDYMGSDDPEEIAPLRSFWARDFHVAFIDDPPEMTDPDTLAEGQALHVEYCAECHSYPSSAILSYPIARTIAPIAAYLDTIGAEDMLWILHVYASLAALALLPMTKFFHLISTPVSLLVRSSGPAAKTGAANRASRRAMSLDACTHCGVCSTQCRVAPSYRVMGNADILPSEKVLATARMVDGRGNTAERARLAEGHLICTRCGTCTRVCPSGIDLQDMWEAVDSDLNRIGFTEPFQWIRHQSADQWATDLSETTEPTPATVKTLGLSDTPESFWACIQCTTCTSVCPVVAVSEDPQRDLDWTPQQVMNLMRLQLKDLALGSRMVWDCVTCYQCQEHCPQGVKVADVLYELRNEAYRRLKPEAGPPPPNPETDSDKQ